MCIRDRCVYELATFCNGRDKFIRDQLAAAEAITEDDKKGKQKAAAEKMTIQVIVPPPTLRPRCRSLTPAAAHAHHRRLWRVGDVCRCVASQDSLLLLSLTWPNPLSPFKTPELNKREKAWFDTFTCLQVRACVPCRALAAALLTRARQPHCRGT